MKLFQVVSPNNNVYYFDNRPAAKAKAKELGVAVHRGPDHWKGESDGTVKLTPSSKGKEKR